MAKAPHVASNAPPRVRRASADRPEQTSVAPFPLASETVGRPYIRPHRIAQAMRDEEMIAELAHKRLNAPPIHVRIGRTISRFFSSEG